MSKIITPWGPVGYITYKRTYSRRIKESDINSPTEEFEQTIDRIIEACNKQLKVGFTKKEEKRLKEIFLFLKGSVAGRFWWQLGTKTVNKLGLMSLQNCAATIVNEPIKPFTWTMDALMLGSGVGYNIQREYVYELPKPKKVKIVRKDTVDADFIVPDSREGWVNLLRKVLEAHYFTGKNFSYSTICIRSKGSPIKRFGGLASGPEELCWGIEEISKILNNRANKKVRPIDCLDIMNIIGQIVVAGNVRRCLPENSLIFTKKGLIPIKDIKIGDKVYTTDGLQFVKNKFIQGKQWVSKIETNAGNFYATSNHKMAVLSDDGKIEWKLVKDLTDKDFLIHFDKIVKGKKTNLPKDFTQHRSKMSTTCKSINIPKLSEDIAWYIGLVHGDEYVLNRQNSKYSKWVKGNSSKVCTAHFSEDIGSINKAEKVLSLFSNKVFIQRKKGENCTQVTTYSQRLSEYFEKYIKQPKTSINIPNFIKKGTKEIRGAYLAGLIDSNGAINNRPVHLLITIYPDFAKQVQSLYASLGIPTRLRLTVPKEKGWKTKYNICLIGFKENYNELIGKYSTKGLLPIKGKQQGFYVPTRIIKKVLKSKNYHGIWNATRSKGMNYETFLKCKGKLPGIPIKIKSIIKYYKEVETYDIEVENKHEFFADGILNHNSAQLALGDMDDLQFLNAKRWDLGNIPNWRAMSNNSVVCNDISKLPSQFWQGYEGNGEPYGLINLNLSKSIGRIGEDQYSDPEVNCYNPCCEQSLANYETCCLAEIFLPNIESYDEFVEVSKYLYRINKHSLALKCHQKETEDIVHKNMRMGIGVTGYLQSNDKQKKWLSDAYNELREFDKKYSKKNEFPQSIKLTTVKPSGTLSLLAGVTSGCHPGYSKYYIRRIRMASNIPLVEICKKYGYDVEYQKNFDGTDDKNTVVVSFPCNHPVETKLAKDMSAIDQLEVVKELQNNWSDNAVSCTIYYKKEELKEIKKWLNNNYNNNIKTCSFLLHKEHGFTQAPLEEITKKEYDDMIKKCKPINNINNIDEKSILDSFECEGGVCPVK